MKMPDFVRILPSYEKSEAVRNRVRRQPRSEELGPREGAEHPAFEGYCSDCGKPVVTPNEHCHNCDLIVCFGCEEKHSEECERED